jgi:hypothetical protein
LERECPVCGDPVKWDTGSLTACRDQHSLLGCKPVEVAHRDVAADAYVVGRLGGAARMAVPFLDALPLRDAIDAMEHFGLAAEGDPFAAMSKLNDERHPEIRSVGLRIAVGWPDAFDAVLDRLASRPEIGVGVWGQDSIYGYLVAWARARRKTALGKAVLDAILSHFARRTSVRAGSAAEQFVDENSPFSLIQVADALGIADSAAKAYLIGVGLWPQKTKRGSPVLFPRSIVKEMKEALADQIGVGELPSLLGIGPPQVKVLVATGILRRLPLKLMKSGSYPRYSRAEIAAWIERLAGGAPTVGAIPSGLTSLMFTCRHMTAGGIAGIVTLIDEGRIKVRGRLAKVPGLRSFLVDFAEVRRAVRVKTGGELSPREAAKELGLHLESVWACIRLGLLDHTRLGAQQAVVSREAIAKFRSTYVTATEIAKELSTANRWVISVLKAAGCEPEASRASSPRCRVSLYRRADIPADLAERFRQLREKK